MKSIQEIEKELAEVKKENKEYDDSDEFLNGAAKALNWVLGKGNSPMESLGEVGDDDNTHDDDDKIYSDENEDYDNIDDDSDDE